MTNPLSTSDQLLNQAQELIQAGKIAEAKPIIASVIKADPQNAEAWYTASLLTNNETQKLSALKRALAINPQHQAANVALQMLERKPAHELLEALQPEAEPSPARPQLTPLSAIKEMKPNAESNAQQVFRPSTANSQNLLLTAVGGLLIGMILTCLVIALLLQPRGGLPMLLAPSATNTATPTNTATSTPTFTPTNTSTPTAAPLVLTQATGEVVAELFSAPDDYIGRGRGNFTLRGPGSVNVNDEKTLTIQMVNPETGNENWRFVFYAPELLVGKPVKDVVRYSSSDQTSNGISVSLSGGGCNRVKGEFTVEQQEPRVIVSFVHLCEGAGILQGKITFTPPSLLALTPTISPEKVFVPTPTTGALTLELYSAPGDPVGNGNGNFTLQGPGDIRIEPDQGSILFTMTPSSAPATSWSLSLFVPVIYVGQPYRTAINRGRTMPAMLITTTRRDCRSASGQFTLEQQTPTIVISFSQFCQNDPKLVLKGKLTFTPVSMLTPTPTIPPEKLFAPVPGNGQLKVDLISEGNDPLGKGQGQITLQGPAKLLRRDGSVTFTVTSADNPDSSWNFTFFAPSMEIGKAYQDVIRWSNTRLFPAMEILANRIVAPCGQIGGTFTIEQQTPEIVISFRHLCDNDPNKILKGKITFVPLSALTPTPTILPEKLFKAINTKGKIEVKLESAPKNLLLVEQGQVAFEGAGFIEVNNGFIRIEGRLKGQTIKTWEFMFASPVFEVGRVYDNVRLYYGSPSEFPRMAISAAGQHCGSLTGQFVIESQSPTIVISFTEICNNQPDQTLKGKVIFTPLALLTPTPTIEPSKLFSVHSSEGDFKAELYSAPGEWIGEGRGNFTLSGRGKLEWVKDLLIVSYEGYRFEFYAPVLVVGQKYEGATRYPFNDEDSPGISAYSPGRGCDQVRGEFIIERQSPSVVITFTHLCEGNPQSIYRGTITFTPNKPGTSTPIPKQ